MAPLRRFVERCLGLWRAVFESLARENLEGFAHQERQRAWTRFVVCGSVCALWTLSATLLDVWPAPVEVWFAGVAVIYCAHGLWYTGVRRRSALARHTHTVATLILDPLLMVGLLAADPERLAFLHPFILYVIVRTGIRYGPHCMNLSWLAALGGSSLLLLEPFWRHNPEVTGSFVLLLVLIPVFFAPLMRRLETTRRLEEEQIRLQVAREATNTRSLFLAKVSHELRSPLQSFTSALDVLEMRHRTHLAQDAELVSRMRRAALLLNTQLRDLLTLANGEAGRLTLHPEAFEAGSLIASLAEAAQTLAASKGIVLSVDVPPDPVFVVADSSRIDQVVTNLVLNAIRHLETGHVNIRLRHAQELSRLVIDVADDGPGLPDAVLASVKGTAGPQTSAARYDGSGLGLSIVRTLMSLLDGRIEVGSEPSGGTRFTLWIPAMAVEPEPDARDSDHAEEPHVPRVLVVDDREDVLEALASVIEVLGYACDRAGRIAQAQALLDSRPYDAVLFDLDMPGISGAELARQTRRGEGPNNGTRFIAIGAGADAEDLGDDFDVRLVKPIDRVSLRRALFGSTADFRPSQPGLWEDPPRQPRN